MRKISRSVRTGRRACGLAVVEVLEERVLMSGVVGAGHAVATTVPAFVGTMSPGDTTSPGPVLTTMRPTLEWTTSGTPSGVSGIQINLFDATRSKSRSFRVRATTDQFTLPTGALTEGDSYVWNLRYVDGTRQGAPGTYLYFQAPPVPALPAPVVVSPGSATSPGPVLTTLTPTFTWHAVTGVSGMTGYQLNLEDTTAGTGTSYTISKSKTNFTLPAGVLVEGDSYVWNLRVVAGTRTATPSTYFYFQAPARETTTLPAPVILSPGSATSPKPVLTTNTPTFTWQAVTGVSGMTGYQLNLYDTTKSKTTTYTIGADATSYTLSAGVLVAGDSYVWNLRVVAGSRSGPPSAYFMFQAPAPAVPAPVISEPGSGTSPGPRITTLTPTLRWTAITGVSGMTGYQINLYDGTTKVMVSYRVGVDATSYTLPAGALAAGNDYVWNLRLVLGSTTGPESNYLYFQT